MIRDLKSELRGTIPDHILDKVPRSFDVIGSKNRAVAIIEFPPELEDYDEHVAQTIMKIQRNVVSVLGKGSARRGDFRIREYRLMAGDEDTEVIHKESGCLYRLDPKKTYFSSRESSERERLSASSRDGEEVLVMFSGVGPFPICITKKHRDTRATAVELNPDAHNYCVENVHLNGVAELVTPILGDVREVCSEFDMRFDRILMPLPKGAHRFLDVAVPILKPGGILHFYHWTPKDDLYGEAMELVTDAFQADAREVEFTRFQKVSQYSPGYWKVRVDARVQA
jgi:tRNA (guanine37-N1)-methyltransferase